MEGPTAFLIDGTACCYRAFYAIRSLSTRDGRPTNAIYGFARILASLRAKEHPDYLGVAFDVGKPTFRHEKFVDYKAQRKPMPDALICQIPVVKALLAASRIPVFEREGYEAEDVLATIAKRIASRVAAVYLVTGDKDALQLVNSHVKVYNPQKEERAVILDAASVRERYGVGPDLVVDLMALMGDEIDNIPGVPGIGQATAAKLLQQFGTLDALYQRLDEVESPARRASLKASRKQVELSRELARIDDDVPIDADLEDLKAQPPDVRALRALFRELEFKKLLSALDDQAPAASFSSVSVASLDDDDAPASCLAAVRRSRRTALGCWADADGGLIALATEPTAAWVGRPDLRLADWLADAAAPKVCHDAKTAIRSLAALGMPLRGIAGDTMIIAHLLNPARADQSLNDLADEYLEEPLPPIPDQRSGLGAQGSGQELLPSALSPQPSAGPYAQAACAALRLHALLEPKLAAQGLASLYAELELPLIEVLAQMEATGIALDLPYLAGLRASMDATLSALVEEVYRLAGCTFNLNSPKQLASVLFERLQLPVIKRTKTGPSTDSDVLQQLADRHPLPGKLMHYRELAKLVSTYVDALPKLADPATGRIHTSFNQTATATGRLSSSNPNLQNIPIKTELGRSIRKAFVPGIADGVLLSADYTQIELRILAHLSKDAHLADAFRRDRDIHRFTASLIYGVPESEVQSEQRNAMKAINYGIIYGMTPHGLSKELGVPFEEAQAFIDAYFERYLGVRRYLDEQIARARRDGFVQTLLGRRRYVPEVNSPDMVIRQFGERMAVNAPIQGTAADLIKRAMVELSRELPRERLSAAMLLQVHDELVFECPQEELTPLSALVRRVMEGAITLEIPLTVALKSGPNWLDLVELPT